MRFYSYRDPHLDETLARFAEASTWLSKFDPSKEGLEGFIVATVASLDAPIKPRELIRRQAGEFFAKHSPELRRETRRQVIETDVAAVRAVAPIVKAATEKRAMCVFGNREILESSKAGFNVIELVK